MGQEDLPGQPGTEVDLNAMAREEKVRVFGEHEQAGFTVPLMLVPGPTKGRQYNSLPGHGASQKPREPG